VRAPAGSTLAAQAPPPPRLVYVTGEDGVLERRAPDDASAAWNQVCVGSCGRYLPADGTYRLRGRESMSAPFSLPVADMGSVVLRFDDDGRVWARPTPRALRQAQPFVPQFVLYLH
jgi:hypothetical protein